MLYDKDFDLVNSLNIEMEFFLSHFVFAVRIYGFSAASQGELGRRGRETSAVEMVLFPAKTVIL